MGLVEETKRIKEVHPNYILLFKSGEFYKAFGKDAYILSNLFGYKIKMVKDNVATCGFPLSSIYKVRASIEEKSTNYMLIDPRNNYDIDTKEDFRNLNEYDKQFEKAYANTKCKNKIQNIADRLDMLVEKPNFKEIIRKVEDILDEAGEI